MFSTSGGYHEYIGGYHEYIEGCSVHQGDTMSTSGDIMSTLRDVQYIGVFNRIVRNAGKKTKAPTKVTDFFHSNRFSCHRAARVKFRFCYNFADGLSL